MARKFKGRPFWRQNLVYIDLSKLELIDTHTQHCGTYDVDKIKNKTKCEFTDDRHHKRYEIEFVSGDIWMTQVD